MEDIDLAATGGLMLVAGHETTVNLIANGTLTMLRNPDLIERLRTEPEISLRFVEELLRVEPPVQYIPNRVAAADIEINGTTIPRGAHRPAPCSREPRSGSVRPPGRVRSRPTREPALRVRGGIHYCFGAPLARLEGQLALTAIAGRLEKPRLTVDPPPYRPSPVLRGPIDLEVDVDAVVA